MWQPKSEQQVLTVAALLYDDSGERVKAFVVRRSANRSFLPGVYELVCGHVRFGENIVSALGRIVKEKLHVEVTVERPFYVFDYLNSPQKQHVAEIVYLARLNEVSPSEIKLTRNKHAESLWVSLETLERDLGEMKTYSPYEYEAIVTALAELEKERLRKN